MEPPIRKVIVKKGEKQVILGDEKVLFRHDESFYSPTAIALKIPDSLDGKSAVEWLSKIEKMSFERAGQKLEIDMAAIEENIEITGEENCARFAALLESTTLPVIVRIKRKETAELILTGNQAYREGIIVYTDYPDALQTVSSGINSGVFIAVGCSDIDQAKKTGKAFIENKLKTGVLVITAPILRDRLDMLTTIRREALLAGERAFSGPVMVWCEDADSETAEITNAILKYASIVAINSSDPEEVLAYLTLRQNIFTDPRRPIQVEARLYKTGDVDQNSPLLVTTNFSLTYFTVIQEIEASRIPAYLLIVDTDGTSVLTAWSADRFNAAKIIKALDECKISDEIKHKNLIIPGYVASLKEDIEEISGWRVIPGPREAVGIPQFLRNYMSSSSRGE
jgi:acetyl-CoA decarbonylase/synthase complex subunit gamma